MGQKTMRIYISLPMANHEDTVRIRYDKAKQEILNKYGEWAHIEFAEPCNLKDFTYEGLLAKRDHDWAWYMGRDLEELLRCDTIYMTRGYLHSKGCRVELAVARERDLKVLYSTEAEENL